MKVPDPNAVAARLLKIPAQFGTETVFERRTLRIGWRWFLQDFPEGWDKPRDLQGAVEAIVKAAEATNEGDGVQEGQETLPGMEPDNRCSVFRSSKMPSGKSLEEQCVLDEGHGGKCQFDPVAAQPAAKKKRDKRHPLDRFCQNWGPSADHGMCRRAAGHEGACYFEGPRDVPLAADEVVP